VTANPTVTVRTGNVLAYRLLDVADAIDLAEVQRRRGSTRPSHRGARTRDAELSLVWAAPPVEIALGTHTIELPRTSGRIQTTVDARLFDYGVVSVRFQVPIEPGTELASLVPWCDELYESPELDRHARELVAPLLDELNDAVEKRHDWAEIETYTIVQVRECDGHPAAAELLTSEVLASLIVGEPAARRLSRGQRDDVLEHAHSYFDDDLVVIDWNSAFILDPSGRRDVVELLELATSQLLELRYYDGLFDIERARVYREFGEVRRRAWGPWRRRSWVRLAHDVLRRLLELTEFTERVDNALKVTGDFYLARVYESAVRRFRIQAWRASIEAKQALLARAYGLVRAEIETRRNTSLELVVILLIGLEIALAIAFRRP
jgi:hypothetical protein